MQIKYKTLCGCVCVWAPSITVPSMEKRGRQLVIGVQQNNVLIPYNVHVVILKAPHNEEIR